jgi:hypothetical protein
MCTKNKSIAGMKRHLGNSKGRGKESIEMSNL